MDNYKRMKDGLIYDPGDPVIGAEQQQCLRKLGEFNRIEPYDVDKISAMTKELLASCGEGCFIQPPFNANWGGKHLSFGDHVYANFNLTVVDDGNITVGNNVKFGPNVVLATAGHPVCPALRDKGLQYNKDIHIGNNVWIGAGTVVCPGVTIGDNTVIGAGSVVTKDIPGNVVAFGSPCKVHREISDYDDVYFFRDEKIDIEL